MAGVDADISLSIVAALTGTGDLGTPTFETKAHETLSFKPGTDAVGKANVLFADNRSIAASSNDDLDLTGSLTNAFGATIAQAEVVAIYVKARATNVNNVVIGGAAATVFVGPFADATDKVVLKPGEWVVFGGKAGWAVGAGTADLLRVANSGSGTAVVYDIIIIGRTVAA